jgi:hypothetical protein
MTRRLVRGGTVTGPAPPIRAVQDDASLSKWSDERTATGIVSSDLTEAT